MNFPFDSDFILKKKKSLRKKLLSSSKEFFEKRIAVLGGSTTSEIVSILELFLLNHGIRPVFYESEYNRYWQDAMFENQELATFKPDIIFVHTSSRNIINWPSQQNSDDEVERMLEAQFDHFVSLWTNLKETYQCPIIQNNFERPNYRLLGNRDISDLRGKSNYVSRLNQKIYGFARNHGDFYIHDIDYLSAVYGLDKWHSSFYWYMYKYALNVNAIPEFAFNLANIIKAILGKNKKAFVLDLDNTLWGGVVGDDGVENLEIGPEMPMGQAYAEFQEYIKFHKDMGIILTICSKNDEQNALAGLQHPNSLLNPEDFTVIKANWNNKDENIYAIAEELNIGTDSLVFVDDNPAEREIVSVRMPSVATPDIGRIEEYISVLDHSGFFENVSLSAEDRKRSELYRQDVSRKQEQRCFGNYEEYLYSLSMQGSIEDFKPINMQRIVQLTNKSNQFNLTTKRYTESEMQQVATNPAYIRLCGQLRDKFGDNGIVSVVLGRIQEYALHIELWLMSCRVLKRDMELAMLDRLAEEAQAVGLDRLIGYYFPTAKNGMVRDFYRQLGFECINEDDSHNTIWSLNISNYVKKNKVIHLEMLT